MSRLSIASIRANNSDPKPITDEPVAPIKVDITKFWQERSAKALARKEANTQPVELVVVEPTPEPVKSVPCSVAPAVGSKTDDDHQEDWESLLKLNANSHPHANTSNMLITMRNAPALTGSVAYDTFQHDLVRTRVIDGDPCHPVKWTSSDTTAVEAWVQHNTAMTSMSDATVKKAVEMVGREHLIDTLKMEMEALPEWDGVNRLDSWLIDYAEAEDNELNRIIGRKFILSMVDRAMIPGCICKRSMILYGNQDIGKSGLCKILVGNESRFDARIRNLEDSVTIGNQMRGKHLIEIAEGVGIGKADQNVLKNFLSMTEDKYTKKHQNDETVVPRRVVFVITTNDRELLSDPTGHSRFMPVHVGQIDFAGITAVRDQLMAEGLVAHRAGERNGVDKDTALAIEQLCANYTVVDDLEEDMIRILSGVTSFVNVGDLVKKLGAGAIGNGSISKRVKNILIKWGWKDGRTKAARGYSRTPTSYPALDPELADRAANGTTNIRTLASRRKQGMRA